MKEISHSNNVLNVLCLEDVFKDAELLNEMLLDAGYQVSMDIAAGKEAFIAFLKKMRTYDLILADYTLPRFDAPAALKLTLELRPGVPFICVSGTIGEEKAVDLLKLGATDYVLKDKPGRLIFAVRQALEGVEQRIKRMEAEAETLKLIHELEVHQIELKLQNEELILAKDHVEVIAKKYVQLYDFAPCGYFTLTRHGKIIELNFLGAQMLGKERSRLINSSFNLFVSIDTRLIFSEFLEKAFNSNVMETCELTLSSNVNSPMYVSLTAMVSKNEEQCNVTMVDITDRKLAEKELRKLLRAIEQSPNSIIIASITGTIEYVNPATRRQSGYDNAELIGKNTRIFSSGIKTQEEYAELWNTIISGKIWKGEFHNKKKNGEFIWEEATISPLTDIAGNITHYLAIRMNITEKKKLLNDLIKSKGHAEESDRLKSAFLANMSHEVRTPLNSIIGFSELLGDPDFEEGQKNDFLLQIMKNGNNLLTIISDIMDISKMESGEFKIHKCLINAQKFISSIKEQFSYQAEVKKLELKLTLSCMDEDTIIFADVKRLSQIFNNLIGNAIKFTAIGRIEIGYYLCDQMVEFYVRDTGIGIPAEFHDVIFNNFRQIEGAKTRTYGGNGLGLAICKNLVELMGGTIWLESEPDKGSTFHFTMPYGSQP